MLHRFAVPLELRESQTSAVLRKVGKEGLPQANTDMARDRRVERLGYGEPGGIIRMDRRMGEFIRNDIRLRDGSAGGCSSVTQILGQFDLIRVHNTAPRGEIIADRARKNFRLRDDPRTIRVAHGNAHHIIFIHRHCSGSNLTALSEL